VILPPAPDLPAGSRLAQRRLLVRWLQCGLDEAPPPPPPESEEALSLLVPLAIRAGLAGLLQRGLGRGGVTLPPAPAQALARATRTTLAHNLLLLRDAATLARRLRVHGVPGLFIKGAALLQTVIPDPSCRAMADLDLLVRPADAGLARVAAREAGYRFAHPRRAPSRLAHTKQNLVHEVGGQPLRLEIHTHPDGLGHRGPPTGELLGRAQATRLDGEPFLVPSPADSALLLAVNWTTDLFAERLKDCLDLAALVQRGGLDLADSRPRARRWRIGRTWDALLRRAAILGALTPDQSPLEITDDGHKDIGKAGLSSHLSRLAGAPGPLPALLRPFLAEGTRDALLLLARVGWRRVGDGWAARHEGTIVPVVTWPLA
jgi:hypothetical protein